VRSAVGLGGKHISTAVARRRLALESPETDDRIHRITPARRRGSGFAKDPA
jgi:hypothetical protein